MQRSSKDLGIFGLRYLEEEEAKLNDIVGCLAEPVPPGTHSTTAGYTYSATTGCDENDTDYQSDDNFPIP